MNSNLIFDTNLNIYYILIGSGIILSFSLYYLINNNYIAIPSQNVEVITQEEIDAIINENAVTVINSNNLDDITDSESEIDSWYQSSFHSDSDAGFSDISDIVDEYDLFFMPFVDFNVCSIQELKLFEFTSLYARELIEHSISEEEIMEFLSWYSDEELTTNWINDDFITIISIL
jgi:hypothetical protein